MTGKVAVGDLEASEAVGKFRLDARKEFFSPFHKAAREKRINDASLQWSRDGVFAFRVQSQVVLLLRSSSYLTTEPLRANGRKKKTVRGILLSGSE